MVQERLEESVAYIHSKSPMKPKVGLVLGSGLGAFVKEIDVEAKIPYDEIPHFLPTSVEGHSGVLILGKIPGKTGSIPVATLQGRIHYYEGRSMNEVVFPTRTLAMLGIEILILTNAAGGLDENMNRGDFMIISDHVNLMGDNPLKGANLKKLGPRFPDLTEAYDKKLIDKMDALMNHRKIPHHVGVYCGVSGPTYETPAEVRYLKTIGGNAVGMSTVPEAIAANHLGLRVAAMSCITNKASGISTTKLSHGEVTDTARSVEKLFCGFLAEFISSLKDEHGP